MSRKTRKLIIALAVIVAIVGVIILIDVLSGDGRNTEKYEGVDLSITAEETGIGRQDTYDNYILAHQDAASEITEPVLVDIDAFTVDNEGMKVELYGEEIAAGKVDGNGIMIYRDKDEIGENDTVTETVITDGVQSNPKPGKDGVSAWYVNEGVLTGDESVVTWKVNVPQAGMYNIRIEYIGTKSRGVDIEREVLINGEIPFNGASTLRFSRMWADGGDIRTDNRGNQIRPSQKEVFGWQTAYLRDDKGYQIDPYCFFFEAGENTISLRGVNEPMIIRSIELTPVQKFSTYDEYSARAEEQFAAAHPDGQVSDECSNFLLVVQGEAASLRSAPSLYARYDRSSSNTDPYSVTTTVLNYIGGNSWTNAGEWIEWDFEVPEDGYYNITIKSRQLYQRGSLSCRAVYIDGEIPFADMSSVAFFYGTEWEMQTLGDQDGSPYRFYLTKGSHKIRLEVTLGEMGEIIKDINSSIDRLNEIYRKLLVVTGVNPDRFRDYQLYKQFPEIKESMSLESKRLYKIVDDTVAITGQKSDRVAVAQTLAIQLESFVKQEDRLIESFTNFKDNITSLGTAMQNMSESKLDIDLIVISGEKEKIPTADESFFDKAGHEISSCVSSFFVDYNAVGDTYGDDDENVIDIWIVTGRDQSTVLKTMIDNEFTPMTAEEGKRVGVNLKLVDANAILTAVVAGNGPDIVLSVDGWFAVNYAMRNAVEDLTQFDDFSEVTKPFYYDDSRPAPEHYDPSVPADEYNRQHYSSSLSTLTYVGYDEDGNVHRGVYGLPETLNFNLLFYRKDLLDEMGLEVPQTWDDLINILPTIQGNNYTVAVPFPDIALADISVMNSLVYQRGGEIYAPDARKTLLDEEAGVEAFKLYTSLYNDYGLPTIFDFVSRFRSGEMPLGLASYSTFNTLMISAPEIRGLWDFTLFPGTYDTDGNLNRTVQSNGLCCMMIKTDDDNVKQNAWKFMKWWVSADTQAEFGREMESILGASARYQTANKDAIRQLAWSHDQLKVLTEQMKNTKGFPEIAGGYSTTRHITNAIRKVITTKEDPRETLLNYTRTINEEIKTKRQEFNLPVD